MKHRGDLLAVGVVVFFGLLAGAYALLIWGIVAWL